MPAFSISTYIYATLAALFLILGLYCKHLSGEVDSLKTTNTTLTSKYNDKVTALTTCSDATAALKTHEEEMDKASAAAVEKAKIESVIDYKASQAKLFRKPVDPVVNKENEKDYGGPDIMVQLKDYLSSQQFINEVIDNEKTKSQ